MDFSTACHVVIDGIRYKNLKKSQAIHPISCYIDLNSTQDQAIISSITHLFAVNLPASLLRNEQACFTGSQHT